ncbi:MAG: tetratricopeptide repeat protein [Acidiphilium sp.]
MPDIFDEVAEDLRAERTRKFLFRYSGAFVAAAVLVLVGIGGWKLWQQHVEQRNLHAAAQYVALTDRIAAQASGTTKAGDIANASALTGFAAHAPSGYAALARMRAAALYIEAGDLKSAATQWEAVAAPANGADKLLRGLADLLWAQHEMGVAPEAQVLARLKPLTQPANPWHDVAQVNVAVLDMQAGRNAAAKSLLQGVSADPVAPANLRNLAEGLIAKLNG